MGAGADGLVTVQVRAIVEQAQAALEAVAGSAMEATTTISDGLASANEASAAAAGGIVINLNTVSRQAAETAEETGVSLKALQEEFASLAEGVELSSLRSVSAFGAFGMLSKALGVGIIGAMGAALLNRFKDTEVELYHLSEATGVSISSMVQLQSAMSESGTNSDRLGIMLTRLSRAILEAQYGSQQTVESFNRLGVSTDSWSTKMPATLDVLMQLADAFHNSSDATTVLGSASMLLGRNVISMVGFMKQGSEAIREQMARYTDLGDSQQRAASGAMELQALEAMLGAEFKGLVADAFPSLIAGIEAVVQGWLYFKGSIDVVMDTLDSLIVQFNLVMRGSEALAESFINPAKAITMMSGVVAESQANWASWKASVTDTAMAVQSTITGVMARIHKEISEGLKGGAGSEDTGKSAALRTAELEASANHQKAMLLIEKEGIEAAFKMHEIDNAGRIAQLQSVADREEAIERQLLEAKLAIAREDPGHPEKVATLQGQIQVLIDKGMAAQVKSAAEVLEAKKKFMDEELKANEKTLDEVAKLQEKHAAEAAKLAEKKAADASKAAEEAVAGEAAHLKALDEMQRAHADAEFAAGRISEARHAEMLKNIENQEFESQKRILEQKLAAVAAYGVQEASERQKILNQLQALEDKHNTELEKIDDAHLKREETAWKQLMTSEQRDFVGTVDAIARGQETIVAGALRMTQRMLGDWISFLAQKLMRHIAHTAMIQSVEASLQSILAALHLTSAAEEQTVTSAEDVGDVTSKAGVAAATAYAAWAWDPVTAAAMAAEAFAATMAFAPAATAQRGGIFGEETFTLLHPHEMVLPERESTFIQTMAAGGAGAGGESNIHFHMNFVDASAARQFWNQSEDKIVQVIQNAARAGKLRG